jgi:hypothetical protein
MIDELPAPLDLGHERERDDARERQVPSSHGTFRRLPAARAPASSLVRPGAVGRCPRREHAAQPRENARPTRPAWFTDAQRGVADVEVGGNLDLLDRALEDRKLTSSRPTSSCAPHASG